MRIIQDGKRIVLTNQNLIKLRNNLRNLIRSALTERRKEYNLEIRNIYSQYENVNENEDFKHEKLDIQMSILVGKKKHLKMHIINLS
ncbi:MAG: hypothetical protein ACFFC3_09705 [Candidatus Odinarchaeota archaeon]